MEFKPFFGPLISDAKIKRILFEKIYKKEIGKAIAKALKIDHKFFEETRDIRKSYILYNIISMFLGYFGTLIFLIAIILGPTFISISENPGIKIFIGVFLSGIIMIGTALILYNKTNDKNEKISKELQEIFIDKINLDVENEIFNNFDFFNDKLFDKKKIKLFIRDIIWQKFNVTYLNNLQQNNKFGLGNYKVSLRRNNGKI